jgi:hypothetical protein
MSCDHCKAISKLDDEIIVAGLGTICAGVLSNYDYERNYDCEQLKPRKETTKRRDICFEFFDTVDTLVKLVNELSWRIECRI